MSIRPIRGKILRETPVTAEIRLMLFRNDEKGEFKIQIALSQGHIYDLKVACHDEKTAIKEYEELLEKLKNSKKN